MDSVFVKGVRCEVIRLFEKPTHPKYEVMAPEGMRFMGEDLHSLLCFSIVDMMDRLKSQELEICPVDCACKD